MDYQVSQLGIMEAVADYRIERVRTKVVVGWRGRPRLPWIEESD